MITVGEPVQIVLPAADWLQLAGILMTMPVRPGVVNHLIDAIGQQVLRES